MADPVSVVSLALTVCQGLLSYYSGWNAQGEEVRNVYTKIEGLKDSLNILQQSFSRLGSSQPVVTANVAKSVDACKDGVERLNEMLQKCQRNPAPTNIKEKLRALGEKSLFPFRRDTLKTMENTVRYLQENLHTAVQGLQMFVMFSAPTCA